MSSKEQSIETFLKELEAALDKGQRSGAAPARSVSNPFAGAGQPRLQDKLKPLLSPELPSPVQAQPAVAAPQPTAAVPPRAMAQPTLLPAPPAPVAPPPVAPAAAAKPATQDASEAPRQSGMIAAVAVLLVGAVAVFGLITVLSPTAPTQTAAVPPPAAAPIAQPDTPVTSPATSESSVSMGAVSADLVPPTTEGLSAPRRIRTQLIVMDGDREVTQR